MGHPPDSVGCGYLDADLWVVPPSPYFLRKVFHSHGLAVDLSPVRFRKSLDSMVL